jgi:catechol 2,3-dioxygenase-like lactoylglutathione lyase family enzyme
MIEDIAVISIWAPEVPQTAHFYRDVLGLELLADARHDHRPHFKVGDAFLVILHGEPHPATDMQPEDFPLFAFRVRDLEAAVGRLQAHGVELPWGVKGAGKSRYIKFYDPAGNLLEITQGA